MKRFSMAMMGLALAGLMTMVSCRKPVMGFTNGEARTVTVSAVTESGGGSKTSIDGLNVKWSEGDVISMNGCELTLKEGAGTTEGVFEGTVTGTGPYYVGYPAEYIRYDADPLSFSINIPATMTYAAAKQIVPMAAVTNSVEGGLQFHNAVNMLKLQLKGDDTEASKLKSIELTSTTSNLSGDINVTFNGGVPEFAAIAGDGASKTMTVSFGGGLQLTEEATCVYIPLAKINGGDLTVRFNCDNGSFMEKKVTVTEAFNDVNNMLSAPELPVNAEPVPSPKFTVSENTTVEFAPGNLYWDGSSWMFEENQWDYRHYNGETGDVAVIGGVSRTTPSGTVGSFFWSKMASVAYAASYNDPPASTGDVFFTNAKETTANPNFHVNGETGDNTWRTISYDEVQYLLCYRNNCSNLYAWKELDDGTHKGLVILPDDTKNPSTVFDNIKKTTDLATYNAVFLPAAGERSSGVRSVGTLSFYWSSTPDSEYSNSTYGLYSTAGAWSTYPSVSNRFTARQIRLVRNITE